ncbi:hypothetical protein [Inconstantimicrobium porci]|uniref:Endonuclease/exonuclease/phosphatase domain-containing protein n=1 Tax=Inconstantimicrobium porci TaxID=2652291 RepID=A0A7X2N069_9CLOT|nr:hypothetical protein [Inconstantimicrobium porci]MSR92269.1 hypothetical protein [Inconstantimicrobium porci]
MNYLFWNVHKNKNINNILCKIIINNNIDIVALAEYDGDGTQLLEMLSEKSFYLYEVPKIACNRISIFTKYNANKINHLKETDHYTLKLIPHESLGEHIIAFVHLSSNMYKDDYDKIVELSSLRNAIENEENKFNTSNSIIVGDFNMNPFEKPIVLASATHALSSRNVVEKLKRVIDKQEYKMFYNPMWNLLGDESWPPGTYYYSNSSQIAYFWHMFDQVIIRPQLINNFDFNELHILTKVDSINLINKNKIPDKTISDHLPILFRII